MPMSFGTKPIRQVLAEAAGAAQDKAATIATGTRSDLRFGILFPLVYFSVFPVPPEQGSSKQAGRLSRVRIATISPPEPRVRCEGLDCEGLAGSRSAVAPTGRRPGTCPRCPW